MNGLEILIGICLAAFAAAVWTFKTFYMPPVRDEVVHDFTEPTASNTPPPISEPTSTLLFNTPQNAFHAVRVMCDEAGLTLEQKNIVCAAIYQESRFDNRAVGENVKNGVVWSTDWGLCQVNDTPGWHIGPGLRFKSVQDVLDHPERAVAWMIQTMKNTGKLQPWASYTSSAYKQWLSTGSPMWKLKTV